MPRKQVQARADEDTVDALEEYADDVGISRSEAIRRILRSGLGAEGYQVAVTDGGLTNAVEDLQGEIEHLKELEQEKRDSTNELRRIQSFIGAAAIAYVAVTLVLPSLDAGLTLIWAVVGVTLATVMLLTTHRLWGME